MAEHPILFSAPMVRAIMRGAKTQTRRPVGALSKNFPFQYLGTREPPPTAESFYDSMQYGWPRAEDGGDAPLGAWLDWCPYGKRGDRLWVRENGWQRMGASGTFDPYYYDATSDDGVQSYLRLHPGLFKRRPSIFMPREFCRLVLEVQEVGAERLNSISEADAKAEGVTPMYPPGVAPASHRLAYSVLWNQLNGRGAWDRNPWVWVVTFRVQAVGALVSAA